jgi:hypothetical protein
MKSGKYTLKASITVQKAHLACIEKGSAIKSSLPWQSFIFCLSSEDNEVSDGSSMLFFSKWTCKNNMHADYQSVPLNLEGCRNRRVRSLLLLVILKFHYATYTHYSLINLPST